MSIGSLSRSPSPPIEEDGDAEFTFETNPVKSIFAQEAVSTAEKVGNISGESLKSTTHVLVDSSTTGVGAFAVVTVMNTFPSAAPIAAPLINMSAMSVGGLVKEKANSMIDGVTQKCINKAKSYLSGESPPSQNEYGGETTLNNNNNNNNSNN